MNTEFKAILWDNDGVLVDTERVYFEATRYVLASVGVALSESDYQTYFLKSSSGAWHLAAERGATPSEVDRLRERRNDRYIELLRGLHVEIEGARDVLKTLAADFRMAVVTSSRRRPFQAVHATTGFMDYFEFALVREDYNKSKPDPEPYLTAAHRMGVDPASCLVVEDSERGLISARSAGMTCWAIPNGLSQGSDFSGAHRILDRIGEIPELLAR